MVANGDRTNNLGPGPNVHMAPNLHPRHNGNLLEQQAIAANFRIGVDNNPSGMGQ
jgi:hypothetical protein